MRYVASFVFLAIALVGCSLDGADPGDEQQQQQAPTSDQQDTSKTPPPPAVVDTGSNTLVLKTRHD